MARTDEQIYEYACHEGNYGMVNLLKGARVQETGGRNRLAGSGSSSGSRSWFSVRWSLVQPHAAGQSAKPVARPNFDGIWNSATTTPLERPLQLKDKAFFTPEEAAAWEQQVTGRNQRNGNGHRNWNLQHVLPRVRHAHSQDAADVDHHRPS